MEKRIGCRAIIFKDNKIVLIRRVKNDREYYVYPGGGLENNESHEECVTREIEEELSVSSNIINELYVYNSSNEIQYFYLVDIVSGDLKLAGPEKEKNCENNLYEIILLDTDNLEKYNIYPLDITNKLIKDMIDLKELRVKNEEYLYGD